MSKRKVQLSIQVVGCDDKAWIKVCNANSLSNGDLIGFDYNNKKILIAKVEDKIYATDGSQ
jgi:nitrite reductase/ring-hydroxylating ferredoxin subunit